MKIIYTGKESSGKTLRLSMVASDIAWRNFKWKQKTGKVRPIASNFTFSQFFHDLVTKEYGLPILYWKSLDELALMRECDVFIDEVGNYFDSRMWAELSLEIRAWLTQAAKTGVEIYGAAQDFAQVDKAFRRLVNELYMITKLVGSRRPAATKPQVKKIWGLCMMRALDPNAYDEDKKKFTADGLLPSFFFIERKYCEIFDTNLKLEKPKPPPLRHIERRCELRNCHFIKTVHA